MNLACKIQGPAEVKPGSSEAGCPRLAPLNGNAPVGDVVYLKVFLREEHSLR